MSQMLWMLWLMIIEGLSVKLSMEKYNMSLGTKIYLKYGDWDKWMITFDVEDIYEYDKPHEAWLW